MRVEPLIERYVDGALEEPLSREVEKHVGSCARCAARVSAARQLLSAFAADPTVRAPRGFADRVMDAVYREALIPRPAESGSRDAGREVGRTRLLPTIARMYRRLGLSFMLAAAVLAASLFIPRVAYPALFSQNGADAGFDTGRGGIAVVRNALDGADNAVRELLGEPQNGGSHR
jgi:anti-sigma factor RsiW